MTAKNADTQVMTKTAFLAELRRKLGAMPEAEAIAAIAYYDEYLSEAGPENEAAAIAELGSPAQVAAGIMGQQIYADTSGEDTSTKKGLNAIWLLVLAILASPIAIPLAFALIALILAVLATALAAVFSLFVGAAAFIFGGIIYLGLGVATLFVSFATGLVTIGIGLASIAIGAALSIVLFWAAKHIVNGVAREGSKLLKRYQTRKEAKDVN